MKIIGILSANLVFFSLIAFGITFPLWIILKIMHKKPKKRIFIIPLLTFVVFFVIFGFTYTPDPNAPAETVTPQDAVSSSKPELEQNGSQEPENSTGLSKPTIDHDDTTAPEVIPEPTTPTPEPEPEETPELETPEPEVTPTPEPEPEPTPEATPVPTPTPTPMPDPEPVETTPQEIYVVITPTGSKYHYPGCRHVNSSTATTLTLEEAKSMGYTPCGTCHPPM